MVAVQCEMKLATWPADQMTGWAGSPGVWRAPLVLIGSGGATGT